jgi:class 3 adenylate cyclase/TolB-like protein/Tfp pilus assembly protein PilF
MGDAHLRRRLTAVLMADVVGYSRLMGVDEEGTHRRLAGYVKDLLEPKIADNHGRLIRSAGDGFLVEFDSAVDAVRCGLDIQHELAEHNAGVAIDRRIQLRIGINAGDVIVENQDIYGNSVNIAARLEGLAEPGGVCVTRGVRDQLEGQPNLSFEDRGERRVKNIRTPIRVYRVKYAEEKPKGFWESLIARGCRFPGVAVRFNTRATVLSTAILASAVTLGALSLPTLRDQWRAAPRSSIIVMPFKNLSTDPAQDYFADAVTDDLTTDLSRLPGAFVIARDTAFTYKGKPVDPRQVGEECGIRYLVEGSLNRVGTRLRTNARLINTASAAQIWADRFETEVADLFDLEETVTGRIASTLGIELVKAEGRRVIEAPTADTDAIDLRARAMSLYYSSVTPQHSQEARRYLEESVRRDPQSAEAWGWLGEILVAQYLKHWNDVGKEEVREADHAVRMALAIDPNLALAHYADGFLLRTKGEHQAALAAFTRALELDPNFARAYAEKGNELTLLGRPGEALPLVKTAMTLSPRDPSLGGFFWIIGRAHFFMGRYSDAIPWLQKSVSERPSMWYNRLYLVGAYTLSNENEKARKALREFNGIKQFQGYTIARIKSIEEANPDDNPVVVSARQKMHEGVQLAGMAEQ